MALGKKPGEITSFTVDMDNTTGVHEMPSVTKLLNRKKLEKLNTYQKEPSPPPPVPPPFRGTGALTTSNAPQLDPPSGQATSIQISMPALEAVPEIQLSDGPSREAASASSGIQLAVPTSLTITSSGSPSAAPTQSPSVRRSARKSTTPSSSIAAWERTKLATLNDPLAKGVSALFQTGAESAVFLGVVENEKNGATPLFKASAQIDAHDRLALWTGLQWNPLITPELWNHLIQTGQVELSPPGTVTHLKSNRNTVRAAFGVGGDEWLMLVRVGSPQSLRGVLGVVSKKTLNPEINALRATFDSTPSKS